MIGFKLKTMNNMRELYQKNKGLIIFLIALLALNILINVLFFAFNMEINSDYLANFFTYTDTFKSKITLPTDNYLHQMPLYFLAQRIFGYTPFLIYFVSIVETLFCFIFFVFFYIKFISNYFFLVIKPKSDLIKALVYFVPLFFLFNLKYIFILLDRPFNRTLSYGITFLFLFLIFDKKKINYWWLIFLVVFAFVFFSDPLIIYTIGLPLLISFLFVYLRTKNNKFSLYLSLFFFVAVILSFILRFIFNKSGYFYIYDSGAGFATLETIGPNFKTFIEIFLSLFNAFFFGDKLADKGTILHLANLIIVSFGICGLFYLFKEGIKKNNALKLFIPLSFIFIIFSYIFSNRPEGFLTMRFISLLPFLLVFGLIFCLLKIGEKNQTYLKILMIIIALVSLTNIFAMKSIYHYRPVNIVYKDNFALLDKLSRENLKYGYAGFWNASINTFFSKNEIKIRQVFCNQGKTNPFLWIVSDNFYRQGNYQGKTFLLWDNKITSCPYEKIISQFGLPEKTIEINYDNQIMKILIFNYNIASRF